MKLCSLADVKLAAVVRYSDGPTQKARTISHIRIEAGGMLVATAVIGGRASQQQALAEFRRNPKRFQRCETGWLLAQAVGLVPAA